MPRCYKGWVEHAATFTGPSPPGHSYCARGKEELPMMRTLRDASNPRFTGHWKTKSCVIGTKQKAQRKAAIDSAIMLCCNFKVHGEMLEKVEVFKYLGRLLAQDDDGVQAIRLQIRKARVCGCALVRCFRQKKCNTTSRCQVLQGSGAVCADIRQQNVESNQSCACTA